MNKDSQEIIKKQLSILPPKVYSVITNIDFPSHIKTISDKHKLRVDQSAVLEDEIMLVMLGIEHPDVFVTNLSSQGHMSKEDAAQIAIDVNETIFKLVRQELVNLHQEKKRENEMAVARAEGSAPVSGSAQNAPAAQTPSTMISGQPPAGVTRTLPKDVAQTKLEQSFRIPPSATTVKETSQETAAQKPVDPYREPTI